MKVTTIAVNWGDWKPYVGDNVEYFTSEKKWKAERVIGFELENNIITYILKGSVRSRFIRPIGYQPAEMKEKRPPKRAPVQQEDFSLGDLGALLQEKIHLTGGSGKGFLKIELLEANCLTGMKNGKSNVYVLMKVDKKKASQNSNSSDTSVFSKVAKGAKTVLDQDKYKSKLYDGTIAPKFRDEVMGFPNTELTDELHISVMHKTNVGVKNVLLGEAFCRVKKLFETDGVAKENILSLINVPKSHEAFNWKTKVARIPEVTLRATFIPDEA